MHAGKSHTVNECLVWRRGKIYKMAVIGLVTVELYKSYGLKWLSIPWAIVGLLGTATAFTVGFKNTQPIIARRKGKILDLDRRKPVLRHHQLRFFAYTGNALLPPSVADGATLPATQPPSVGNYPLAAQRRVPIVPHNSGA
jgi:hypothetical protein